MGSNGKYISGGRDIHGNTAFSANRTSATEQEVFELALLGEGDSTIHRIALKASNGRYLGVREGFAGSIALGMSDTLGAAEVFELKGAGKYTLRTAKGLYLSIEEFGTYRLFPKELPKDEAASTLEQFVLMIPEGKILPATSLTVTAEDIKKAQILAAQATLNNDAPYLSVLERAVVDELNIVRTKPQEYAKRLQEYRRYFKGKLFQFPGRIPLKTKEGVKAMDDAIRALATTPQLVPLQSSLGLSKAARVHVDDSGAKGLIGHIGSDRSTPSERAKRFGQRSRGIMGENCSYGPDNARDIVMQLLIDDGMLGREHRKNILNPAYNLVGVAFGSHKTFRVMCVQVLAAEFKEKS